MVVLPHPFEPLPKDEIRALARKHLPEIVAALTGERQA